MQGNEVPNGDVWQVSEWWVHQKEDREKCIFGGSSPVWELLADREISLHPFVEATRRCRLRYYARIGRYYPLADIATCPQLLDWERPWNSKTRHITQLNKPQSKMELGEMLWMQTTKASIIDAAKRLTCLYVGLRPPSSMQWREVKPHSNTLHGTFKRSKGQLPTPIEPGPQGTAWYLHTLIPRNHDPMGFSHRLQLLKSNKTANQRRCFTLNSLKNLSI